MSGAFHPGWRAVKTVAEGRKGIVAAQNQKAARAGVEVLEAGGNAVDAAIAVSFALGATEPWMSGLGGGGAMLVYSATDQTVRALDMGMIAPRALDPSDYPLTGSTAGDLFGWPSVHDDRNLVGPHSVAVPTLLSGITLAHQRFGSLPWRELVAPAIALAREGLEIDWWVTLLTAVHAPDLARFGTTCDTWLPGGFAPVEDWSGTPRFLTLPGLAETLAAVADDPASFYSGDLAAALVRDLQGAGSRITHDDLAAFTAREREPLIIERPGGRIFAMPGLFAGVSLARAFDLADGALGERDPALRLPAVARALLTAYAERLERQGDAGAGSDSTSHLCVVDGQGTIVTLTQTLLSLFGSKLRLPATGLLMNNGIMWFDPRPGRPNSLGPGKRPLSNMCPVIGGTGTTRFGLGASGGRRILPAVFQLASALVDRGMTLEEAFAEPRIDVSGIELVTANPQLPAPARTALAETFALREATPVPYPTIYACPSSVLVDTAAGQRFGAAEPVQPWAGAQAQNED